MKKFFIVALLSGVCTSSLFAQDKDRLDSLIKELSKIQNTTNIFVMTGDAYTGFKYTSDPNNSNNNRLSMATTGVNPVFLWTINNKLIVEGEVEFQLRGNNPSGSGFAAGEGLEVELEYMNLGYVLDKYMILRAGSFFSSYGTFEDWQHQRITNRMTGRPLGIGHGGLEPGTSLGFNLRGAIPVGSTRVNYSIDLVNAPTLVTKPEEEVADSVGAIKATKAVAGELEYEVIKDSRMSKAIGGRIGFIPFHNSSLEIGVSAHYGKVGARGTEYEKVGATFLGADLSYMKDIDALKGTFLVRSQYDYLKVDNATYYYTFDNANGKETHALAPIDNKSSAYYFQMSYRPTMVHNKFLRKCELAARYSVQNIPTGSAWANDAPSSRAYAYKSQFGVTLNYWIGWNAVVKFSYEGNQWQNYKNSATPPAQGYIVQFAIGF